MTDLMRVYPILFCQTCLDEGLLSVNPIPFCQICLDEGPLTDPNSRDSVDTSYMKKDLQEFIR
jgi:hypothetical protein